MPALLNSLIANVGNFLDDIFAFISAPECPGCGQFLENPRLSICPDCEGELIYPGDGPVCLLCRSPVSVKCSCAENYSHDIPQLYYWAPYTDSIRGLIHQFKFGRKAQLGDFLANKSLAKLHSRLLNVEYDVMIPIPMLKRDQKKRTFNQTELLVKVLADNLNDKYDFESLKKIKPTRLQADLGREERWQNIVGAFKVEEPEMVSGKSILLVDDIVTTGATTIEASKALYKSGVKKITVFAVASSH